MSNPKAARYRFERFELQPGEHRLLAGGTPVAIAPRAFDLLVALLERSGHLVTKEQLLGQVWPGVVVEENALHAQISALRKLLGPGVISTVPGAGYRFELEVSAVSAEANLHAVAAARHNLPKALTSFIGREQQITELNGLLRQTRLLTLSGAGGCGKTRLALELAGQVLEDYPDGVWLIELAALAERDLILQTVAEALGLKERAGETFTQTVVGHLASRHVLLVLDNAEHLLAACAEVAQTLLQRCGQLSILATSRERLGVSGELTYRVPSLTVPDAFQKHETETLAAYESARLFIERAHLQQPRFAVTAQNAPAIASICAHLDGIPLAIELAAARVRAISVEEVNQRLEQRFRLLTDASRAVLPRHRTLRGVIDWSYDLLNEEEKAVFCRASVFAGGFTLDAAERVLSGGAVHETAVLDLLTSLTDKNLLQAEEHGGTTRYGQLETVRQYGRDRLRESNEELRWQRRHLDHFVAYAEAAEEAGRSGDHKAAFERLGTEHENLRAALTTASGHEDDSVAGLRLAGAMLPLWMHTGSHWSEARAWLARFLNAVPAGAADPARAKALNAAGALADFQGDVQSARSMFEECVALRRTLGDRRRLGATLMNLGKVVDNAGDFARARVVAEEGLAIGREFGVPSLTTSSLATLTFLACDRGDIGLARVLADEAVNIGRKVGGNTLADGLHTMAWVVLQEGDARSSAMLCCDALRASDFGQLFPLNTLDTTAFVEYALGNIIRSAVIWGHTERLRLGMRSTVTSRSRLRYERTVPSARAALGDDAAFDAAWRRGAAMTTEQVVEFVLRPGDT